MLQSGMNAPWIAFFTEPYETDSWSRTVYRDVLPRLCALAAFVNGGFELHPFESAGSAAVA